MEDRKFKIGAQVSHGINYVTFNVIYVLLLLCYTIIW